MKKISVGYTKNHQKGQMLVIVLLIMVVGLTVGLYLMSRTSTDISLTSQVTEASRAFNAAEAGIEEAIRNIAIPESSPVPVHTGSDATYTVEIEDLGGTGDVFPGDADDAEEIELGDSFTVWLVPHNDDGSLNISEGVSYQDRRIYLCFSDNTLTPALAVTIFYQDNSNNQIFSLYTGYDNLSRGNGFNSTLGDSDRCGGSRYDFRANLQFSSEADIGKDIHGPAYTLVALRLRPVYAPTKIAVYPPTGSLPVQGNFIESLGEAGEAARRITVSEPYVQPVPFLDYVVYQTGSSDLSHN